MSSSSLLSAQKHNVKEPSCSHLRVFAPKDLSQNSRVDSQHCCAYAHNSTNNGCTVTTILIRRRAHFCSINADDQVAKPGNRTELLESPPIVPRFSLTEDAERLFQQLEAFAHLCSSCQLIYYHPAAEGLLHYVAKNSASALSDVLNKIDEQQVDLLTCSSLSAFLTATLRCQQSKLPDTAVCGGTHSFGLSTDRQPAEIIRFSGGAEPSSPGSNAVKSSIGATNKLLLQKKQNQVASILHHSAGICLAVMLLMHLNECLEGVWQAATYVQKHAVEEQVHWLMGAPAGCFKMPRRQ